DLGADAPRGPIHQMIHIAQTDLDNIGSAHPDLNSDSASASANSASSVVNPSSPTNGKGATGGAIGIGPKTPKSVREDTDKCPDCRACKPACPSGVEYGKLVEHSRALIEREYKRPL